MEKENIFFALQSKNIITWQCRGKEMKLKLTVGHVCVESAVLGTSCIMLLDRCCDGPLAGYSNRKNMFTRMQCRRAEIRREIEQREAGVKITILETLHCGEGVLFVVICYFSPKHMLLELSLLIHPVYQVNVFKNLQEHCVYHGPFSKYLC